jgi:hypothetical protein
MFERTKMSVRLYKKLEDMFQFVGNFNEIDKARILGSCFFAGGAVTSMVQGSKVNDYDLFFRDKETAMLVRDRIVKRYPKNSPDIYETPNALTWKPQKLQIISVLTGNEDEVLNSFDFEHCKFSWTPDALNPYQGRLQFSQKAMNALASKALVYSGGASSVITAILRIRKFGARGFTITASSALKIAQDCAKIDFNDPEKVLHELHSVYSLDEAFVLKLMEKHTRTENGKPFLEFENFISDLQEIL